MDEKYPELPESDLTTALASGAGLGAATIGAIGAGIGVAGASSAISVSAMATAGASVGGPVGVVGGLAVASVVFAMNQARTVWIRFFNNSKYELQEFQFYERSGNLKIHDTSIKAKTTGSVLASRAEGAGAKGCVGVCAYRLGKTDKKLVVMYSNPYDENLYSLWWKVSVVGREVKVDQALYEDMYYNYCKLTTGKVVKANNNGYVNLDSKLIKVKTNMTNKRKSTISIELVE